MDNVTSLHAVVLGLDGFVVLHAEHRLGELVLYIETNADRAFCRGCGVRAESKGRRVTEVRDVPFGDRPVRLVWHKRIWRCLEDACSTRSWSEQTAAIRPRASLSERARVWAVRAVGRDGLSVALVARMLGVGWHTINDAVLELGAGLVENDDRLVGVRALGIDEHNFLRGSFHSPTSWVTGFVDVESGRLLDVVQDRTAAAVRRWIGAQPDTWRDAVEVATMDPYQGYASALTRSLPDAAIVVDHWHIIRLENQMLDEVRRRTQQQTTGHRGRKGDALYDVRKLLLVARDRLTDRATERIETAWRTGDPWHEVEAAWTGKELLRDVYAADGLEAATVALDGFLAWADEVGIVELTRLAGTIRTWRERVLGYHTHGLSNARSESMNLLIKKIKRVGFGFRNFGNYRMRLLLHCGVQWDTPATTRIRGRAPSFAA